MQLSGAILFPSLRHSPQFILTLLIVLHRTVVAKYWPMLYWNSTNPIFRIDNTDHVFTMKIRDKIDIICPYYPDWGDMADPSAMEYSEIYKVSSSWNYDNCALDDEMKLVGVCQNPQESGVPITVVFREFTPKPGGLEFQTGHSYYFISTSTGSQAGLKNRQGGLCLTKNMKLKFDVVGDNRDELPSPNIPPYDPDLASNKNIDPYKNTRPHSGHPASANQNLPRHQSRWSNDRESNENDVTQNHLIGGSDSLNPDEDFSISPNSNSDPYSSQQGSLTNGINERWGNGNAGAQTFGNAAKGGPGGAKGGLDHASYIITEEYYPDEQQRDKPNAAFRSTPYVWSLMTIALSILFLNIWNILRTIVP